MYSSTAFMSSRIDSPHFASPLSAGKAATRTTGMLSPSKLVVRQQLTDLELDELQDLLVVDHVALVERDDERGDADLAGQEDVLLGLRHRAVVAATTRIAPSIWAAR